MKTMQSLGTPRTRFNSGFHDGAAYVARGKRQSNVRRGDMDFKDSEFWVRNHFDKNYGTGWKAGYEAQERGLPTNTSISAWEAAV